MRESGLNKDVKLPARRFFKLSTLRENSIMDTPLSQINPIAQARSHFPGMEDCTYLDLGGRGLLSKEVRAAIEAHLDEAMYGKVDKDRLFEKTEEARNRFAQLINAEPDEITYTKNISEGLNIVAASLDWESGDNVIVCPQLEHPNNIYLWLNLQHYGVEVRFINHRDGYMPVDEMIAAIDKRTRVLTVSSVSFSPGFRTDIDKLGRACRERGVLFLVDGAQSVGVLRTDVRLSNIDALAVSTQKGLLALYGMGYLYVRRPLAEKMRPRYVARFGIDVGRAGAHESDVGDRSFKFMPAARRFDLGNYNFAGVCAVHASLEFLLKLGTKNIEAHAVKLAHTLAHGFLDLGLPVCGGKPGPHIGEIVTVGRYGSGGDKASSDEQMNKLYTHLSTNRVKLSMRRGVLRFAFHAYNNMDDVERVLKLTKEAIS
jgi:cysteine desulfurase/selenocysteine lyase